MADANYSIDPYSDAPKWSTSDEDQYHADRCLEEVQQLKEDFVLRDSLSRAVDLLIYARNEVIIPDGFKKWTPTAIRARHAARIVNYLTATLTVNPVHISFNKVGVGDDALRNKSLRERFFAASWRAQQKQTRRPIFRQWMHQGLAKGEMVMKTVERRKTAWAGYHRERQALHKAIWEDASPENKYRDLDYKSKQDIEAVKAAELRRAAAYPIRSTDVLPDTCYYNLGDDGMTMFAEVKLVPYYQALSKYNCTLTSTGRVVPLNERGELDTANKGIPRQEWQKVMGSTKMLQLVEVWEPEECVMVLQGPREMTAPSTSDGARGRRGGGHLVKRFKHHGYGDPDLGVLLGPYFHAYGITTGSHRPGEIGLSCLFELMDILPHIDQLLTIERNAAFMTGFPAFKRTGGGAIALEKLSPTGVSAEEHVSAETEQAIEPGYIYPYDIQAIDQPRGGIELDKSLARAAVLVERQLPAILQGNVGADATGTAINQAQYLGRLNWQPVVDNAQDAQSWRVGFESSLLQATIIDGVVCVWGDSGEPTITRSGRKRYEPGYIELDPAEDLHGIHEYTVEFKPEMPSNRILVLREKEMELKLRVTTWEQAVEDLGNDPLAVKRGWQLYQLENAPEIVALRTRRVLQGVQMADQNALATSGAPTPLAAPGPSDGVAPTVPDSAAPMAGAAGAAQNPQQAVPVNVQDQRGAVAINPAQLEGAAREAGIPAGVRNPTGEPLPGQGG